uniref:Uncharacterized protein n=1 Tax=Arundo donax TaxID=35708 RepID=A0A0A9F2Z9_ARUDO
MVEFLNMSQLVINRILCFFSFLSNIFLSWQ